MNKIQEDIFSFLVDVDKLEQVIGKYRDDSAKHKRLLSLAVTDIESASNWLTRILAIEDDEE